MSGLRTTHNNLAVHDSFQDCLAFQHWTVGVVIPVIVFAAVLKEIDNKDLKEMVIDDQQYQNQLNTNGVREGV